MSDAPAAGIDLDALAGAGLRTLAGWLTGLSGTMATAAVAGGFGLALIPSSLAFGKWVKLPGPGDVSYFAPPDETVAYFKYTTPDGVQRTTTAVWDPGRNGYRDPRGNLIARSVRAAGKVVLVVSTAALVGSDDEGRACPAPAKDNGGKLGQEYENYMKAFYNPGNPTPSGMAYQFFDPVSKSWPKIDDCQQQSGALAEYKGPNYAKHLAKNDLVWEGMLSGMLKQAKIQSDAKGQRALTWFFAEKSVADFMRKRFNELGYAIDVEWHPMPSQH